MGPMAVYLQKKRTKSVDPAQHRDAEVDDTYAHVERDEASDWTTSYGKNGGNVADFPATLDRNISTDSSFLKNKDKGKELIVYNPFEILSMDRGEGHSISGDFGNPCSWGNVHTVRAGLLPGWSWFDDYAESGGRIWIAWNDLEVGVEILSSDVQFIHCRLCNKRTSTKCLITVVYGECDHIRRRSLWAGLHNLSEDITMDPWAVFGDFNAIIDASESLGRSSENSSAMADFREFITETGLIHLPFTGCPYSWHNSSEGSRSLWRRLDRVLVNEIWLVLWPRASYLCALPGTSDHSPLILQGSVHRSFGGMFRFDNFLAEQPGFLESVQGVWRHRIFGNKMYGVMCRLKSLKSVFRAQRKIKGNLAKNVSLARDFLEKAQLLFDTYKENILYQLVQWCRMVYCKAVELEANMLRQRAKLNWITHGDQCSKFFFSKINARRAMQRVYQIQNTAGQLVSESAQVASEFISFFQSLLGGTRTRRTLNLVFLQPHLQHTLTSEEASALLLPVSQAEVKAAFFDISVDSARVRWLPVRVSEFRPIACCNVMYKAIAKIIVGRIQPVLHSLINYSQNAFVPGRSVADNVLLAQELMAGYNQAKLPQRCTIKIDIQKAYDSVDWDFLLESLRVFNFPAQFIQLIEQCLTSAMFSISLNGSVHGFFKGSRGLRQGDPMSPYLFVMVMELWHVLLKFRTQDNSDFRFHWKCTVNSVRAIKSVLTEFSELSGLHINPGWNHLNLSLAGRTQLIKSVLSSLHLYWASVFILPKSIIKVIESKLRSFLWKGSGSSGLAIFSHGLVV
ncbi:UNVERIFIED_CONTAM: hypothetical protein Sradi_7197800 [Sesamum radiatum]|uniref:Reverse transcriptase domain-containing protein n=1 Tax=Sesamum radiatum TaxID=300843 RepID=A0AAW2IQU6_SESRA